jgi:hypothetical protein
MCFASNGLDDQTLNLWAFELPIAVGINFDVRRPDPTAKKSWLRMGSRAIEPALDNPYDIPLEPGEILYDVNAWFRYYGRGYERGLWPEIAGVLFWLVHRLRVDEANPLGRVFYGPNPDDDVDTVNSAWLNDMWRYWAEEGRLPYMGDPRQGPVMVDDVTPPFCGFCGFHASIIMFGGKRTRGARCHACGQHWRTGDGTTWIETDHDFNVRRPSASTT